MSNLTNKQNAFIEYYLQCWNASEAARRAGYSDRTAGSQGQRLLKNVEIQARINERIEEIAMSANEVLLRLGSMARADMGDFMDIGPMAFHLDLDKAKELGLTHLIKKVKQRTTITTNKDGEESENHWIECELYDAQSALVQLGRHYGLFVDRQDITSGGEKVTTDETGYNRAVSTLADAIGKALSGKDNEPASDMDAAE